MFRWCSKEEIEHEKGLNRYESLLMFVFMYITYKISRFREHDFILCIIFWLLLIFYVCYNLFWDKRVKKVLKDVVFYWPPKDFTPAEIAVIDSWWSTARVFPAMLYDWVAKKYVKLWRMNSWEIYFEKMTENPFFLSDTKYLYAYHSAYNKDPEHDFWELCFPGWRTCVTMRMLSKIPWIERIPYDFFYQAKRQCLDWNAYKHASRDPAGVNLEIALLTPLCIWAFIIWFFTLLFFFFVISAWILIRIVFLLDEKNKWDKMYYLTDWGVKALEQIQWFKKYLFAVEDNKLKVVLREDPLYFEKILPYAIAVWVGDAWINKCFAHLKYDDLGWLIVDKKNRFRSDPEDFEKLKRWIANTLSFMLIFDETTRTWWSLVQALTKYNDNRMGRWPMWGVFYNYIKNYSNSRYSRANWYGWHGKK